MFRFSRVSDILIITLYANLYWRTAVAVKRPIHRNLQMFSSSLWLLPSHMLFFHSCELYCLQQNVRHFEFSQLNTQLIDEFHWIFHEIGFVSWIGTTEKGENWLFIPVLCFRLQNTSLAQSATLTLSANVLLSSSSLCIYGVSWNACRQPHTILPCTTFDLIKCECASILFGQCVHLHM